MAAAGGEESGAGGGGGKVEIALLNPNRYAEAAARRLRPWLAALLAEVASLAPAPPAGGVRSLGVRFAGDRALRRANRRFRGKDQATDVLSFPGGAAAGHLGDILISVPQARRQALRRPPAAGAGGDQPADTERELKVLLLHGVLHCLGYDHEVDGGEMERLERRLRRRWIGAPAARRRREARHAR